MRRFLARLPSTPRARADAVSRLGALAVFVLGLYFFWPLWEQQRVTPAFERTQTTTRVQQGSRLPSTTTVVRTHAPRGDSGFVARAFDDDAATLLARFVAIVLVAFLCGALLQRLWLAQFQFKTPWAELPELTTADLNSPLQALLQDPALAQLLQGP